MQSYLPEDSQINNNEQPKKIKKKNKFDYHRKKRRSSDASNTKKSSQKFTLEEDKLILQLVLNVGPKFQKIHKHFPGKTLAMVKNRYYKYLRYRWEILGQNYKHLSLPQDSYENLCEQQKIISDQLEEEKSDLIAQVFSHTKLLSNARMFVEYLIEQLL
ncbi:unnamed protein product (macronuclear) [Paramecium tetraurelia]|uniref:HTH myb-type domain-containing protein n=1 Tax=Paramecium tetraurelia TaxID=5888 RepID=A0DM59_PARTE|nr:uncharacterized protein GSPATT00018344001 [Paramecium tetraurelia]CAK84126.1 unnamed protein product [Paramecium tetraurelia]|eukprot:XP_001451523.1 hypothetical protein (macronuclear) [Paramecium tetraurelia strain d4-2]